MEKKLSALICIRGLRKKLARFDRQNVKKQHFIDTFLQMFVIFLMAQILNTAQQQNNAAIGRNILTECF